MPGAFSSARPVERSSILGALEFVRSPVRFSNADAFLGYSTDRARRQRSPATARAVVTSARSARRSLVDRPGRAYSRFFNEFVATLRRELLCRPNGNSAVVVNAPTADEGPR